MAYGSGGVGIAPSQETSPAAFCGALSGIPGGDYGYGADMAPGEVTVTAPWGG